MAEITRRRCGELLRKLFEILLEHREPMPAKDALAALAGSVKLSEYETGTYANGARRFEKIVRFATLDTVKAGWLLKSKGSWSVTDDGRKALERFRDPEAFYKEAVRLYREWRDRQPPRETDQVEGVEDALDGEGPVGEREAEQTFEESEERAWQEIVRAVDKRDGYEFQAMVAALLKAMGYFIAHNAPRGKDGGVDVLAYNDPLGTRPPRIKVQVKRYKDEKVDVDGLRSFLALLGDDDVGLFVCTAGFTKDAENLARSQERRRITLLDLERFFDLWVEHYPKIEDSARRLLPIRPIYFLAPES